MSRFLPARTLGRLAALLVLLLTAACAAGGASTAPPAPRSPSLSTTSTTPTTASGAPRTLNGPKVTPTLHPTKQRRVAAPFRHLIPDMPAPRRNDVYSAIRPGRMRPRVAKEPAYLYVPNSYGDPITTVIDQRTLKVVKVLDTGVLSQHVTPAYGLDRLYVEASGSNQIDTIDPRTAKIIHRHPVDRPYNLYFTPDGKHAVVMDEEHQRIVFADPHTFKEQKAVSDPTCQGPNHADFSANGRYFLVSCEFSGSLLRISTLGERVTGRLDLGPGSKPQDVRLAPNGRRFYVADMGRDLLLGIKWNRLKVLSSTPMPSMPHGIYPSRNGKFLYVSDRSAGAVSVFSLAKHKIVDTWPIPGGGTPDMGGISADGRTLWLSGRTTGYIYGLNTRTGHLDAKIYLGGEPHGLLVWPQPGRYSLGHTGSMR